MHSYKMTLDFEPSDLLLLSYCRCPVPHASSLTIHQAKKECVGRDCVACHLIIVPHLLIWEVRAILRLTSSAVIF